MVGAGGWHPYNSLSEGGAIEEPFTEEKGLFGALGPVEVGRYLKTIKKLLKSLRGDLYKDIILGDNHNHTHDRLFLGYPMKANIHPQSFDVTVTCTCGSEIKTRSTKQDIRTTLCSSCHPFFTNEQKFVDTGGQIAKFKKRYGTKS
jgi:large subunit ribosomal protein L31